MDDLEVSHSKLAANAAMVASELHSAGKLAQELSLVAKNTRTLVVRAGNTAQGLKVITEHFSDLADRIIGQTKTINDLAVKITKTSVIGWKSDNVCGRLAQAQSIANGASYIETLLEPAERNSEMSRQLQSEFAAMMSGMDEKLEDIRSFMRSTDMISVTFKLEAIQTGEHEKVLIEMATKIDSLSEGIRESVRCSQKLAKNRRLVS